LGKFAGVPHLKAIRALEKVGFRIIRQSKHVILSDGERKLTIPRANPIDAYTMGTTNSGSCCELLQSRFHGTMTTAMKRTMFGWPRGVRSSGFDESAEKA
jgi:hypothetical protein